MNNLNFYLFLSVISFFQIYYGSESKKNFFLNFSCCSTQKENPNEETEFLIDASTILIKDSEEESASIFGLIKNSNRLKKEKTYDVEILDHDDPKKSTNVKIIKALLKIKSIEKGNHE